jgi:murein DD-endopeptidase MepM/ murein hydrolase activator NlpD
VDLFQPEGSPVFAVFSGTVVQAVRDEAQGGIAGRFIKLSHNEGAFTSSYVHLQNLRDGLEVGSTVTAGEVIGTLGKTGCQHTDPHLHFALAVDRNGHPRYVDPELLLETWPLPEAENALFAVKE